MDHVSVIFLARNLHSIPFTSGIFQPCLMTPTGNSHEILWKAIIFPWFPYNFPIFLWFFPSNTIKSPFSYNFPMDFPWNHHFPMVFPWFSKRKLLQKVDLLLPFSLIHGAAFCLPALDGLALVLQLHHACLTRLRLIYHLNTHNHMSVYIYTYIQCMYIYIYM